MEFEIKCGENLTTIHEKVPSSQYSATSFTTVRFYLQQTSTDAHDVCGTAKHTMKHTFIRSPSDP
jgi:nicotinamidase-related amidase